MNKRLPNKIKVKFRKGIRNISISEKHPYSMDGYKGLYYTDLVDDEGNRVIEIKKTLGNKELFNTFVHEFLHAVIAARQLKFSSIAKEERLVYAIADEITEVLRENPKLFKLLKNKKH
jgi:hypothetical protein